MSTETKEQGLQITTKSLQTLNKDNITDLAKHLVAEVAEGNLDAMDMLIQGKKLELLAKSICDNVKDFAYGKTYATKGNPYLRFEAKVEAAELGTEYDYSNCNDDEVVQLTLKAEMAKKALDARKKFLQGLTKPTTIVTDDGEIVTINPAVKKATQGYKVTL
jgi:hypothetical protein